MGSSYPSPSLWKGEKNLLVRKCQNKKKMCALDNSTFHLLDKPRSEVSSLLPPDSCLHFFSRIGFSNLTARRFLIECC